DWTTEVLRAELRVGGAWEIVMHPAEGDDCRAFGRYVAIERPRRLVFTWHANAGTDGAYETLVTLDLRAIGAATTELTLTQTGLRDEPDRADHQRGFEGCLANLVRLCDAERGVEKGSG